MRTTMQKRETESGIDVPPRPASGITDAPRPDGDGRLPGSFGFSLGRLLGVQIRVDWSLLIIFSLVSVSLGTIVLPHWHPQWAALPTWTVALGAAVLFFVSILLHELAHALVARTQGVRVRRVTLFLFGGIAHMEEDPPSPGAEALIASVGPIVSLAIGLGAWSSGLLMAAPAMPAGDAIEDPAAMMADVGPFATLLLWLGPVNVLLGLFNLVPGFPLDGGRVLRALLWRATGNLVKASRWAAGVGQVFAWTLIGLGAWSLLAGYFGQGLWLVLIGWFLNNAARASYARLLLNRALRGVEVRDLMLQGVDCVPPETSAARLVDEHLTASDQRALPVVASGELLGMIRFEDLRQLPRDRWAATRTDELMTPADRLVTLPPAANAKQALEELRRRGVEQIPVLEDGALVGLVRRQDVTKWLALHAPAVR